MESEKSLIIKKETILNRIRNFFTKLFYNPEIKKDRVLKNEEINKKENFISEIKIQEIIPYDRLRKLQYLIRNNRIDEEGLSDLEKSELRKLYKEQIKDLKNSIENYNIKIRKLKKIS